MNKFEQELNENMAKAFFVRHGEKLGLLVGAGLLGLFVYLGLTLSPDLKDKTPSTLDRLAKQANDRIENASWDELKDYRQAIEGTVATLEETKVPVDANNFPVDVLLARRGVSKPLRTDPKILAPIQPLADVARVAIVDTADNSREPHPLSFLQSVEETTVTSAADRGPASDKDAEKKEEIAYEAPSVAPGVDASKAQLANLEGAVPVSTYMITVRMAVPYKEMLKDFNSTFKNAVGYNPETDRFLIRHLEIQRRVDGGGDDAWEDITEKLKSQDKLYVVAAPDPFKEEYGSNLLTRPFPPVLLQDYFGLASHPLIPMEELPEADAASTGGDSALAGFSNNSPSGSSGSSSSMSSMSAMSNMRNRQSAYRSSGPPTNPGGSGAASQMSGMSGGATTTAEEIPDYKLVRFTDMSVQPGHTYEYRARIWVYDPNNPAKMDGYVAKKAGREGPSQAMASASDDPTSNANKEDEEDLENMVIQSFVKLDQLAPEIQERLIAESALPRPFPMLTNCRPSAWSDATAPINVKTILGDAYVADAEAPREGRLTIGSREIRFPTKEGFLENVVAGIWDDKFGIRVPLTVEEGFIGSLLGGQAVTRVLDPIERSYKKMTDNSGLSDSKGRPAGYKGNSGVVLVDFMGGSEIDSVTDSRTKFRIPTEAMLLDSTGNLAVHNSRRDARNYTWMTGKVLKEDGVEPKSETDEQMGDSSSSGRNGRRSSYPGGGQGNRSGYPGGGAGGAGGPGGSGSGSAGGSRGGYPGGGRGRSSRPPGSGGG